MENLEQTLLRRHQRELQLLRRLAATCRNRLTATVAAPDCRSCREVINRVLLDDAQPDDEAVERAYYHLSNRDGCTGARELRCAEAERLLSHYDAPVAPCPSAVIA